jgi:chromate transporter
VTFVPCFLWIFLGAPFIEKLRGNVALAGAMSAITAAVVGVILNLAIWFALHTLFAEAMVIRLGVFWVDVPVLQSAVLAAMALSVSAAIAIFRFKVSVITTLLSCALAGMVWTLAT